MTNTKRLPERRGQRRVVFVLDDAAITQLQADSSARDLLRREDTAVVEANVDPQATDSVTASLERQGLLIAGTVLVASPYRDGDYAPLEDASDRFSMEKWAAVSTLCSLLGARSVSVQVVEDTASDMTWHAQAGGGRGPVKADGDAKYQHLEKFAGHLKWDDAFVGGGRDLERANAFLQASGLEGDPEVRSLVEARSHETNLLARRTVTVDLSRESERTIEAALSIKVPAVVNVGGTFSRAAKSRAHYKVTFEVIFAEAPES